MRLLRLLRPHWHLAALLLLITGLSAWVAVLPPRFIRLIVDHAIPQADLPSLLQGAVLLGVTMLGREVLRTAQAHMGGLLGIRLTGGLRRQLWQRLMQTEYHFFTANSRGDILHRLLNDSDAVRGAAVQALPRGIYETVVAIVATFAMIQIDLGLALLTLGVTVLATLPGRYIGEVRQRVSAQEREQESAMYALAQERIEAVRLVKSFTAEERETSRFHGLGLAWAKLQLKAFLTIQGFMNVPRILESLLPMLLYLVGGYQVFAERLTIGALVAIIALVPLVSAPVRSIGRTYLTIKEAMPKLQAVLAWLDLPQEPGWDLPRGPVDLTGEIRFDRVSFQYPGAGRPVLDQVSCYIPGGSNFALIGPSGAGKSTMLALLCRLYEPTAGRITIGGRPIDQIHPEDLRGAIAVVSQETFLLHDTIRRNLTFGLTRDVSEAEISEALLLSRLTAVVEGLPQGLETMIGERGLKLSGGERQRVALARAILRQPQILLLDEATSALDNETQAAIAAALDRITERCTTITVAHRVSTIRGADGMLRLESGRIEEVA